jgi:hypothetical protein
MKTKINDKLELDFFNVENDVVVLNVMNFATGKALPIYLTTREAKDMVVAILENALPIKN